MNMEDLMDLFRSNVRVIETLPEILPPETEDGNVEYKLKLVDPSESRFEHLVTQMKWRLQEGGGEAIYEIGVEDNGNLTGLNDTDMHASISTLQRMSERIGASMSVVRERVIEDVEPRRRAAEILVRRVADYQPFIDLRMAVLGNVDAGKSTLLGVITQSELDNGRGRARLNLFRHLHEIQTGRTSSICHEILGFNDKGEVTNYSRCSDAEEICDQSSKLITIIDLAGHQKYLKTTIFGLTSYYPHFAMLVVSATNGAVGTTKEHLGFALALGVPVFVVVTKTDLVSKECVAKTIEQLERMLVSPGCRKVPMPIHDIDQAITAATNFSAKSLTPIFSLSSVTGNNVNLLLKFLNDLPPLQTQGEREKLVQQQTEMKIDMVYSVPDVGTVVGGHVSSGLIRENDKLLLGPDSDGQFQTVVTHSIQRSKLSCRSVEAGQSCTLALQNHHEITIRKGQVLVSEYLRPMACISFEAEIFLLFHVSSISEGFQATLHTGNICQTALIEWMDKKTLQTNQRASVRFRFIKQPEYIKKGTRLLFREGRTKGMGEVTKVHPYKPFG